MYKRVVPAAILGFVLATGALPAASPSFASQVAAIAGRPQFRHAIVAVGVYDLDTHRALYARNGATLMEAASTTKLLTTGTSLALLGPDFRWTTPVYRVGAFGTDGVLRGDLVLVASGDPNLSQRIQPNGTLAFENEDHSYDGSYDTRAVPGDPLTVLRDLAAQVAKSGVKTVDGSVVVDASLFPDQGPEAGTGAIVSPIVVNDNLVDVTVTPGVKPGDPVSIAVSPQTPYVTFVNKATTGQPGTEPTIDLSKDVTNPDGTHTVTITGSQRAGKPILWAYRVPEPAKFAEAAFTVALNDAGVRVVTPPSPQPAFDAAAASASYTPQNLVAKHVSPPLSEDVYVTLKVSDNLHAGLLPYMWAVYVAKAKADYLKAGFAQERMLLTHAGLNLGGAAQQDGLGAFAFFTTDFMTRYLAWVATQPWYPQLHRALPVLGVDGTLFNIQNGSPADGKVFAKTGTWGSADLLNDGELISKGLAGFMTTRRGHHLAFALYINHMAGKASVDDSKDAAHYAGETLGEIAADAYESL
ncbi:MAG TPA: D-alanyl-D-alanine carboxypeptidase/D-alanyl-D-alanine-endopeptidase [Candidatus Acidoferrales bacterium]|nr:D-alanyl-D-alanine carboxypeptidase/D-alanyl-D-alanine-endopeptidase [Candidatus Acidoferrales bacterium]